MVEKEKKIDPFDVEALEKSLNDSATRVSAIWVSFLIFSLYLLTAATTVTHRQLFLAEPLKLPVLNIELPVWGFFFLAPILFVILHAYVLIQVILLARTAAAYDNAVKRVVSRGSLSPEEEASLRQRLANTLFAQIFAGSPRERAGWFGQLLKAMAWITLAIAPILILITFQFTFLPYHSHLATWTHRLLIAAELAAIFFLWPLVLDGRREFEGPKVWTRFKRAAALIASLLFVALSLSLATFPGEPHVNVTTGYTYNAVTCDRWIQRKFSLADMRFDRLALARVDVVDREKLDKIQQSTSRAGESPYQGERTRILRDRDFNCGDFSDYADLRRIDWSGARLIGANLLHAKLEGAFLANAQLQNASLSRTQLQGASLNGAQLQGASLDRAQLQGASLDHAQLQGADLEFTWLQRASLHNANLQGASLRSAKLQAAFLSLTQLQGASLVHAQLQGAYLSNAQLQGASLDFAQLQGASLNRVQLQGASLDRAQLQGASLKGTQLQGASLVRARLDHAVLSDTAVWRARGADCNTARVINPQADRVIYVGIRAIESIPAEAKNIRAFITSSLVSVPDGPEREDASRRMHAGLIIDPAKDDSAAFAETWRQCANAEQRNFEAAHVALLRELVCSAESDDAAIGHGVAYNWIFDISVPGGFSEKLARALLGEDGELCRATQDYDEWTKKRLRRVSGPPPAPASAIILE